MASLTAGTTFTDGVANDVTAAKLGALVTNATPTSGFIQDRTAETVVAVNDTLLIGDASDSNNLKRMTVANLLKAPLVSTSGTIDVLTTGTTTSTAEIITSGTIATLNSTTGTIATLNSTTGTIATLNSTTGTITNLSATTSTFLGTITGSTNVINIGSGQIYKDASGNVGVGTASPASTLHVSASQSAIRLTDTNGTSNTFRILAKDGTTNAFRIYDDTASAERLRIDSSGNVGIGISPSEKLHVSGNAIITGDISQTNGATNLARNSSGAALSVTQSGAGVAATFSGGNVGIGITTPSGRLHVVAATNTNYYTSSGTTQYKLNSILNGNNANLYYGVEGSSTGRADIGGTLDNASFFGSRTAHSVQLISNNVARMTIDSSGNCSIGTATALSKLHVHGDVTLSNTTTATTASTGGISKPATYAGFLTVSINGTSRKIPYYAT